MTEKEIRNLTGALEVRDSESDDKNIIEGYSLKFNSWSEDLGGFREIISPEALKNTDMSDVRALIDHNSSSILGRTIANTLKLEVDDVGLKFRCHLPNTTYAKDLMENIRSGNISQCSFGFTLADNGDEFTYDEEQRIYKRTLKDIKEIVDISVVTYPAYKDSEVAPALRSIDKIEQNKLDREKQKLRLKLNLI